MALINCKLNWYCNGGDYAHNRCVISMGLFETKFNKVNLCFVSAPDISLHYLPLCDGVIMAVWSLMITFYQMFTVTIWLQDLSFWGVKVWLSFGHCRHCFVAYRNPKVITVPTLVITGWITGIYNNDKVGTMGFSVYNVMQLWNSTMCI